MIIKACVNRSKKLKINHLFFIIVINQGEKFMVMAFLILSFATALSGSIDSNYDNKENEESEERFCSRMKSTSYI